MNAKFQIESSSAHETETTRNLLRERSYIQSDRLALNTESVPTCRRPSIWWSTFYRGSCGRRETAPPWSAVCGRTYSKSRDPSCGRLELPLHCCEARSTDWFRSL